MGAQTTTSQDPAAISKRLRPRGSLRTVPRGLPLAPRVVPFADRAADEAERLRGPFRAESRVRNRCSKQVCYMHLQCLQR
jgi:hypothetical protein